MSRNKEKRYVYDRDKHRCFLCGKELKFHQITLDHYLPLSKGGTSDVFNIVISCKKCNKLKGDTMPEDYVEVILKLFIKGVEDDIIQGDNLNINKAELKKNLLNVHRIEDIANHFIFQSKSMRFYVEDNKVEKIVYLGGIK